MGAFGTAISIAKNFGKDEFNRIYTGTRKCMQITVGITLVVPSKNMGRRVQRSCK
jgi:hypothetical protein